MSKKRVRGNGRKGSRTRVVVRGGCRVTLIPLRGGREIERRYDEIDAAFGRKVAALVRSRAKRQRKAETRLYGFKVD